MTEQKTFELAEKFGCILNAENILLICHKHPDGDTLGSAAALRIFLQKCFNKNVEAICIDPMPKYLNFISGIQKAPSPDFVPDAVVSIDCASLELMGEYGNIYKDRIDLKIDHHIKSDGFAKLNFVDSSAAATGEIIYSLMTRLSDGNIPKECIEYLYIAIETDTGGLKFSNTTPFTLRTIASLIESGCDFVRLNNILFESKTKKEIAAILCTYANIEYYKNDSIAFNMYSLDIMKKYGLSDEDLGCVNGITRDIEGVNLSITVKQNSANPEKFRVSMRSCEPINVCEICDKLGGGGHIRASGAEVTAKTAEEAKMTVLKVCGIDI